MKSQAAPCPITKVALLLSDTWTMLIMHHVIEGPKRFCDLEEALAGISTRTLTAKLKKLASQGLIKKGKDGLYAATPKGKGLRRVENAMRKYEAEYL